MNVRQARLLGSVCAWFLGVLATPAMAYQAHYFVITERAGTGELTVAHHQLVEIDGTPSSTMPSQQASRLESRLFARVLDKATGAQQFSTVSVGSPWLRGEFHGVDGIDGRWYPAEERTYVLRIPVADPGTVLEVEGLDSGRDAASATAPRLSIDLDPLRPTSLKATDTTLPAGWATGSILNNGTPANRLDLLVVAEGYTAAQQAQFVTDANTTMTAMLNESPYSVMAGLVNITYLYVPSNQSGADQPNCDNTFVDTAFDATFCTQGSDRLLTVNNTKVFAAAANVPNWDKILVIVNSPVYGGAGGAIAVGSLHAQAVEIMKHEFGHQFTLLDDEYTTPFPGFPACSDTNQALPACGPNTTDVNVKANVKWLGWMDGATQVPTNGPLGDPLAAGVWEGARYLTNGMYRQCFNGKMNALGQPFCKVDSEAYVKRIYGGWQGDPANGVSNIDPGATPATATVNAAVNSGVNFSAKVIGSNGANALTVTWLVDNVQKQSGAGNHGSTQTYTYTVTDTTQHTVTLRVTDNTALLLAPKVSTQSWTVKGQGPIPNIIVDVNKDGAGDALSDGLMIMRYLFGITGAAITNNAVGTTGQRLDPTAVTNYLVSIRPQLDVDGNGAFDALTDGLLIIRYMFGLRGNTLIANALAPNATRTTSNAIEAYLATLLAPN